MLRAVSSYHVPTASVRDDNKARLVFIAEVLDNPTLKLNQYLTQYVCIVIKASGKWSYKVLQTEHLTQWNSCACSAGGIY